MSEDYSVVAAIRYGFELYENVHEVFDRIERKPKKRKSYPMEASISRLIDQPNAKTHSEVLMVLYSKFLKSAVLLGRHFSSASPSCLVPS